MKRSRAAASRQPAEPAKANAFDVSVVLNLHNEARYLKRTLLSLEEAARYARQFDISIELVVVLDNADKPTRAMAEAYDHSAFDAVQVIHVRNGSLGLSRNDGIAVARGEYIATADADDLVSFDYLQKMYMTARSSPMPVIVFPEYYLGFGSECYIWKIYDHSHIGNSAFFASHPYVSRVVFQRLVWDRVKYADTSGRSGYAYEDWHFNCECLAAGLGIGVAKGAMVFYRQRPGSLMRQADAQVVRSIPPSRYFEPATFLKINWAEMTGAEFPTPAPHFLLSDFLNVAGVADVVSAANKIDPMISLGILQYRHSASNLAKPAPAARTYFEACRQIGAERFTDVLLVPFMAPSGAEKYILSVIDGLRRLNPDARLLVLATQKGFKHGGLEKLPADALFVDLCDASLPELDPASIEFIVLRLLQHVPGVKRVHLKNCEFVDSFVRKFARYLKNLDTTYYYFCDPQFVVNGVWFTNGQSFDLVSETASDLTRVISDHAANVQALSDLIGADVPAKSHTLYTHCALPDVTADKPSRSGRMIWASRIDSQKRPDLLPRIAARLRERNASVTIDVHGGVVLGGAGPGLFDGHANLSYRGPFNSPDDLRLHDYDAMIYTAAFDGLPNIVLEAMAAGLPVIAPDVGGIGEAVDGETGYLVPNEIDDDALVERYVAEILDIYGDWNEARRRGANARQLIAERHSAASYMMRIGEIFAQQPSC